MPNFKDLPPSLTNDEMEAAKADGFASSEGASLSEAALDQKEHQQMEFGNPSLQQQVEQPLDQPIDQPQYRVGDAGTNSGSAWDSVRATGGSQTNAWDKVRKQNIPQQQRWQQPQQQQYQQRQQQSANQTAEQFETSWDKMYQDESTLYKRDGGFSSNDDSGFGPSSPLGSEDFPRSREDFERSSRESNSKYSGGSAFSS
ncbi:hypothetical protein GGI22_007525 [Coemansia erecta]|nr:hypothetical protein GGI22_007525 [Coemansia erecta]